MQRTLFYLPHELFGVPLFGAGWLLLALVIGFAAWLYRTHRDPTKRVVDELSQNGLVWAIAAAAILLLLPSVEIRSVGGEPIGVAVRGYGVFLLAGVVSGIALALYRASRAGVPADDIFGLAMWLFVGGIGGARLFYIIEYRSDFLTGDLITTAGKMLDFTRGGLVVYGSIIGGTIAMFGFVYRTWTKRQRGGPGSRPVSRTGVTSKPTPTQAVPPSSVSSYTSGSYTTAVLRMGDVVVPCLFLGIFFGRIGCLMNGCCYGGRCEDVPWALQFPPGSPVYSEQIATGELLGLELENVTGETGPGGRVSAVEANSPADREGIKVGSFVSQIYPVRPDEDQLDPRLPEDDSSQFNVVAVVDARPVIWTADQLPDQALAVSPAQLISSGSGLLICLLLLTLSGLFRFPPGVLMATGFAVYALARFGEEMVRTDEPGQFGTQFSISQWISMIILPAAILSIIYIYWKRPTDVAAVNDTNPGTGTES